MRAPALATIASTRWCPPNCPMSGERLLEPRSAGYGRVRRLDRCSDQPDPVAVEEGVEGATELRITVVDQQPRPLAAIVEVNQQVARLLEHPGAVRVARARDVLDPAAADANEHEHIQPAQQSSVDGEKVAGERRRRLCS